MNIDGFKVHGAAVLVVLGTGVGYAVTGAGGTEVTLAGPQVLRLIQQAPAALSSYASMKMTMTMAFSNGGRTFTVREEGLTSRDGQTGTFVVHAPGGGHDIDVSFVNHTMYAPAPAGHYPFVAGKRWLSYVLASKRPTRSAVPSGNDALAFLRLMPGATGPVRVVGHERIDKARTTHYRVTIDVLTALTALLPRRRFQLTGQLQPPGEEGVGISLELSQNGDAEALRSFWAASFHCAGDSNATAYQQLAVPCAAWGYRTRRIP